MNHRQNSAITRITTITDKIDNSKHRPKPYRIIQKMPTDVKKRGGVKLAIWGTAHLKVHGKEWYQHLYKENETTAHRLLPAQQQTTKVCKNLFPGSVVRTVDSAIHRVVIFSTAAKRDKKQ